MRWFILINAENNYHFDLNGSIARLVAIFLGSQDSKRAFGTCAIWFTLSRAAFEPTEKCEMNFCWIVQIHVDLTSNKVFLLILSFCPCYFRDKVINGEVCVHIKHICKWVYSAGSMEKGMYSKNCVNKLVNLKNACKDIQYRWSDPFLLLFVCIGNHMIPSAIWNK